MKKTDKRHSSIILAMIFVLIPIASAEDALQQDSSTTPPLLGKLLAQDRDLLNNAGPAEWTGETTVPLHLTLPMALVSLPRLILGPAANVTTGINTAPKRSTAPLSMSGM